MDPIVYGYFNLRNKSNRGQQVRLNTAAHLYLEHKTDVSALDVIEYVMKSL